MLFYSFLAKHCTLSFSLTFIMTPKWLPYFLSARNADAFTDPLFACCSETECTDSDKRRRARVRLACDKQQSRGTLLFDSESPQCTYVRTFFL